MTSSINLAALGFGGMDTSSLVTGLVSIEEEPLSNLENEQQNIQSASTTISSFSSTLSSLSTAATTLSDPSSFQAMTATSSDSSIVATTNTNGAAVAGDWSVSVANIAQAQRTISNGDTSSTNALNLSGNLSIQVGSGAAVPVAVSSTDSITDIANKINSANLGVQASVFYDGSQYHLLVSGNQTGDSNAITFDESGLTAGGAFTLGLSGPNANIQDAKDAKLTIGSVTVTSPTNQITNAIPGVTLAITQPTTSPANIAIAGDASGISSQIQSFVTAYNSMISNGHTAAGYGTALASNTLLQGDTAVNSSLDQLSQLVSQQIGGPNGDAYTTLASVGITLNDDGTLAFDSSTFASALQADPSDVTNLFVTQQNGSMGIMGLVTQTISSLTDPTFGAVTSEITGFSSRSSSITTQITSMQAQIAAYQAQLEQEFTTMNTQLAQYKQISNEIDPTSSNSSTNSTI